MSASGSVSNSVASAESMASSTFSSERPAFTMSMIVLFRSVFAADFDDDAASGAGPDDHVSYWARLSATRGSGGAIVPAERRLEYGWPNSASDGLYCTAFW